MCSEYTVKTSPKEIEEVLGKPVQNEAKDFEWGKTVRFFTKAPVLQKLEDDSLRLSLRIFPSSPMPNSRLSGLEGQSDGGTETEDIDEKQIKRIYDMKFWKIGFAVDPVLVPLSEFTEFAYWGSEIGTAQSFKIPGEKVQFAAGIGIRPFAPKGDQGSAFSILTHTATDQMLQYHHRFIALFAAEKALGYLESMTPIERFDYVIEHRYQGELEVKKIRHMAKGWEKRIENQERKLKNELRYCEVLKANGVEG